MLLHRPGNGKARLGGAPGAQHQHGFGEFATGLGEGQGRQFLVIKRGFAHHPIDEIGHGGADGLDAGGVDGAEQQLAEINCGSALYPDDGATLILAAAHQGQRLRLTGPGINGTKDVALAVSPGFWAMRDMLCIYPEGFDIFFVDGDQVIGIPRSTKVEVL